MTDTRWRQRLVRVAIAFACCLGSSIANAQLESDAAYTDRVHLKNGDVITGNIKELDRGKLRLKTRTMDTVFVNWVDVESLETDKHLRVQRSDGTFNYGLVAPSEAGGELVIRQNGGNVNVPTLGIAAIQPIRERDAFWRRIEGDVSTGIDYKKASDILTVNLSSNFRFREPKYEIDVGANWNETTRTDDQDSSRADLTTTYTRLLRNRWFWKASAGLERNQELGIDLRGLIGGTAGRYLFESPTTRFELNAGLAGNRENRTDNNVTTSVEGLISSSVDIFKHTLPVTRLSGNVSVFPGITESGRMRVNATLSLRNEIIRSLFWDLAMYGTWDNKPPDGAASEDYGIITSLGASF